MAHHRKNTSEVKREEESKLTRGDRLLLEEYKNCTRLLMNENRIFWTRFQTFLAICTAFFPIWTYLASQLPTPAIVWGAELTACLGFFLSFLWLLVIHHGRAFNQLWQDRLQEIENLMGFRTFNEERETDFWLRNMHWWQRFGVGQATKWVARAFIVLWAFLIVAYLPTFLSGWLSFQLH